MRKPKGFRAAEGVSAAMFTDRAPSFIRPVNLKGKYKAGVDYEAAVHDYFRNRYGEENYKANPWIMFKERRGQRWCQPDALLLDHVSHRIIIIECKLKHTGRSWWQLHKLYLPVVQFLFPGWEYACVEVCKHFDPSTPYPSAVHRIDTLMRTNPVPVTNSMICRL